MRLPNKLAFKWGHPFLCETVSLSPTIGDLSMRNGMCPCLVPANNWLSVPKSSCLPLWLAYGTRTMQPFHVLTYLRYFKQYGRPKGTPASPKQPSKTLHNVVPKLLIYWHFKSLDRVALWHRQISQSLLACFVFGTQTFNNRVWFEHHPTAWWPSGLNSVLMIETAQHLVLNRDAFDISTVYLSYLSYFISQWWYR